MCCDCKVSIRTLALIRRQEVVNYPFRYQRQLSDAKDFSFEGTVDCAAAAAGPKAGTKGTVAWTGNILGEETSLLKDDEDGTPAEEFEVFL